jgi:tetrapyrrole methylase family protein/MazG family protein
LGSGADHSSIRRNLLEEAYEVCGAIDEESPSHIQEELGDLLMRSFFTPVLKKKPGISILTTWRTPPVKN